MSGDPKDPRDPQDLRPGDSRSGYRPPDLRPAHLPGERPPAESADPSASIAPTRPTPPWDLTTRVPAAARDHVSPEDLTLLAMQLLSGEEIAVVSKHVEHCAECRRELSHINADLGAYAFTVDMQSPPASARERLFRQVAREKKAVPISHSRSAAIASFGRTTSILVPDDLEDAPKPSILPTILAWTGWAAAAALAVTAGLVYKDRAALRSEIVSQTAQLARLTTDAAQAHRLMDAIIDPHAQRVTLTAKPLPTAPIGRATYNAEKGTLVFLASDLDPLVPDKTYELWLIPADGTNPLPAGTFHPDDSGNASVILPNLPKGVEAKGFGVTIEDEGGSQTPTKPIILTGF